MEDTPEELLRAFSGLESGLGTFSRLTGLKAGMVFTIFLFWNGEGNRRG